MRLFLSGLAAISLLAAPVAGCKKEEAPAAPAATENADKPAGEQPAGEQPAGGAEKPADAPAAADEKPADAPAAADEKPADAPADAPVVAAIPDEAGVEAGIKLMEEFGTIMGANKADCDKLADELKPFIEKNGEGMKAFNATMEKASAEIQEAVKTKYAARMEKTMGEIMAAGMACGENEKVKAVMASMADEPAPAGDAPAGDAPAADAPAAE